MSLLSDLNNKIKALSTRVGTEVKSLWEGVNTAQSTATAAQTTANTAQSTATAAQSTANTAKSTADTANNTANSAKTTANTAQSTANTANSTANTANSTANTALNTANAKVSKSGDTMTGPLTVPSGFRVLAQNGDREGGELILDAASTSLLRIHIDNYDNQCRWIFVNANGDATNVGGISASGVLNLPNGTSFWIA